MLGHRAGHIHQAEHDRLRHRLGMGFKPPITQIYRIDIGDAAKPRLQCLDFGPKGLALLGVFGRLGLRLQRRDLIERGPPEGNAPGHGVPHGPGQRQVGGRAAHRIAGAVNAFLGDVRHPPFFEVGQFEVFEEQIEKFLARQNEAESVLGLSVRPAIIAAALAALGSLQLVAFDEILVARQDQVAIAALPAPERGFVKVIDGDRDFPAVEDVAHPARPSRFPHGALHVGLGAAQETLSVFKALTVRVKTPVDDLHRRLITPPALHACTTLPIAAPAARYSRDPSCGRRTRCASFRCRRPFWSRTKSPAAGLPPARTSAFQ